ncbi:PRP22 [[Candida] subhashii]|uniref:RNA helicase n=1 Tax=[Candida] subhashii TaxID=561895 RepID=A0A8J5QE50_9ASCO|nr:PRP22 [[Candida] subhashii]KAG7660883.1 PRP22 [[Candida] subhashii]
MQTNDSSEKDSILNKAISKQIRSSLQINDEDLTITKFLLNLFKEATSTSSTNRSTCLTTFEKILKENGGDDFPREFGKQIFDIIYNHKISQDTEPTPIQPDTKPTLEPSQRHPRNNRNQEETIEVGKVYRGYISDITPYGAFIRLNSPQSYQSGLCHISQISFDGSRLKSPESVLQLDQQVFVKPTEIKYINGRKRISLSMRGIDQETGLVVDISSNHDNIERGRNRSRGNGRGVKRKLTSPERWEIRQLIASGAASADDYPELEEGDDEDSESQDNDGFGFTKKHEPELETEIELNKIKPKFLEGQTLENEKPSSSINISQAPGSMTKLANEGSKFVREFKNEKLKEKRKKEQEIRQQSTNIDSYDPLFQRSEPVKELESDEVAIKTEAIISEWKIAESKKNITYGKRTNLPIEEQRRLLPVYSMRSELVESIKNNQFLVIVGETGSGKTTQIVQYIYEEGINKSPEDNRFKIIGCTQPRRVAAVSVAKRVSEEVGCTLGEEVGYSIRFEDKTSPRTTIKYMTDGMLEREALNDPYMSKYSVIMLDEAHERTIATDVLFSLLKRAALKNPNLKVIITSATLDSDKFSKYFNDCPILSIPGRTFPVEILHTREPEVDYLAAALDSVMQIHISEPPGDILVFLTGQEEIDTSCEVLFERMKILGEAVPELIILPVYSALPSEIQTRIFEPTPPGSRKVILATNIAETSITIDGIYYVVDPGFVKVNAYDPKLGMDSLRVVPISQAQANQRSGRAGRTGPGKCYRLYTEKAYMSEMLPNSVPEIQRKNLASTILMLKAMGINDLLNFEFMDPPSMNTMLVALQDLYALDALDDDGNLTALGREMADLPMEPALAKTLIKSVEYGCTDEILSIVAMLSVQTIFFRPKDKQNLADQRKARFHHPLGDHLTLLNVFQSWQLNNQNKTWCQDNFIQERSMKRAMEVRKQLKTIMIKFGHQIRSCGNNTDRIRMTLCAGYFKNSVKRDMYEGYKTLVEQTPVYLHPSSSLFGKNPEYLIYHTLLLTTKEYMHCVCVVEPKWFYELAPRFFMKGDPKSISESKKQQKIIPLSSRNSDDWRISSKRRR